jgi:dimethylhistidine N-methyltransferase
MEPVSQEKPIQGHAERLSIRKVTRHDATLAFREDVRRGLSAEPKHLFPKYFYDELGSQLFEAICRLPEYYLTSAENEILLHHAAEIVDSRPGNKTLIEMGSGSALKTRLIIEALLDRQPELLFIPVDISASALEDSSRALLRLYPQLSIKAFAGDYYDGLAALDSLDRGRTLALFLGSNIGNFEMDEAGAFLRAMRRALDQGDALLLGADLQKDARVLETAYDDPLGVTAAFILNQLARVNRELDADFDLRAFKLRSIYNQAARRIEVYLESTRDQTALIKQLDMRVRLRAGERLHMENSYKYDLRELSELAAAGGFELQRTWFDQKKLFSSNLLLAV